MRAVCVYVQLMFEGSGWSRRNLSYLEDILDVFNKLNLRVQGRDSDFFTHSGSIFIQAGTRQEESEFGETDISILELLVMGSFQRSSQKETMDDISYKIWISPIFSLLNRETYKVMTKSFVRLVSKSKWLDNSYFLTFRYILPVWKWICFILTKQSMNKVFLGRRMQPLKSHRRKSSLLLTFTQEH